MSTSIPTAAPRRLLQGSEAIAEAMIAAGCRFFAGYPMTPFTEVLEHMARRLPEVGGVCMNAESELEAVGMAWGAAATGTPAATGSTGQGLSLMQESLSEITLARLPLVVLNMARAQGDYWQATRGGGHGDYRHIVLAPVDVAEAVELVQLAFHLSATWRNPVLVFGDYYLAHTARSVEIGSLDFGPAPSNEWALTGESGGTGRAKLVSFLGSAKQRDDVGYDLSVHYTACAEHTARMLGEVTPKLDTGMTEAPRWWSSRSEPRARTCGPPCDHCAPRVCASAGRDRSPSSRSRPRPSPTSCRGPRPSPSTRTTPVRWSMTSGWRSSAPRQWSSSAASAWTAPVSASLPTSTWACCDVGSSTWWGVTGERIRRAPRRPHRGASLGARTTG